jgi:hypothetical protein
MIYLYQKEFFIDKIENFKQKPNEIKDARMTENMKKVVHLDEKVLKPKDRASSSPSSFAGSSAEAGDGLRPNGLQKSLIGKPKVYDLDGNLLADEENLVVITGREYLAQLISNVPDSKTPLDNPTDLTMYKITHFGVGDGGSSNDCPPTTTGPFDDDTDLGNRVVIGTPSQIEPAKYISGGTLKQITFDGEIKVVSEEHTVNVPTGGEKVIDAYTAIRYRMYLQPFEPKDKPFRFNEAGLFAVKWVWDTTSNVWLPESNTEVLFARFTTLDKWLDYSDGIMIEWYVLV